MKHVLQFKVHSLQTQTDVALSCQLSLNMRNGGPDKIVMLCSVVLMSCN